MVDRYACSFHSNVVADGRTFFRLFLFRKAIFFLFLIYFLFAISPFDRQRNAFRLMQYVYFVPKQKIERRTRKRTLFIISCRCFYFLFGSVDQSIDFVNIVTFDSCVKVFDFFSDDFLSNGMRKHWAQTTTKTSTRTSTEAEFRLFYCNSESFDVCTVCIQSCASIHRPRRHQKTDDWESTTTFAVCKMTWRTTIKVSKRLLSHFLFVCKFRASEMEKYAKEFWFHFEESE